MTLYFQKIVDDLIKYDKAHKVTLWTSFKIYLWKRKCERFLVKIFQKMIIFFEK